MQSSRRELFRKIFGGILALVGIKILSACSSDGSSSSGGGGAVIGGDCQNNGTTTSVGGNHGHTDPTVPAGDVIAGAQQTYSVAIGTSDHAHTVTVSAAHFATLQGNTGVVINSSFVNGHSHPITINCV